MTRYLENRGWDRADANPLQDVLDAKRKIEEGAGFRPTDIEDIKIVTYPKPCAHTFTGRIKCSEPNLSQ